MYNLHTFHALRRAYDLCVLKQDLVFYVCAEREVWSDVPCFHARYAEVSCTFRFLILQVSLKITFNKVKIIKKTIYISLRLSQDNHWCKKKKRPWCFWVSAVYTCNACEFVSFLTSLLSVWTKIIAVFLSVCPCLPYCHCQSLSRSASTLYLSLFVSLSLSFSVSLCSPVCLSLSLLLSQGQRRGDVWHLNTSPSQK